MDEILKSFADFSSTLSYRDLPAVVVTASKASLLDTLGCAMGAFDCDTADVGRSLVNPASRKELAGSMIGSKQVVAADGAAFVNTCMIRYMDLNDHMSGGGHPSDCLGGLFAVAPQIRASGERLITAVVVAYEIIVRLRLDNKLRDKGWDQGFGIAVGAAAGLANLMGLNSEAAQHAIAITAVANLPMRASRAGQLSMWKGAATAYAVRNAVFGVQLAAAGMTGPEAPFTGRHGLIDLITGPIELPPFGALHENFLMAMVNYKYWPVANNLQALIWAGIELRKQVSPEHLASLDVQSSFAAWSMNGSEPAKWDPTSRETADHSLPYILASALRHGSIDHRTFAPESYRDPSIRPLMNLITARVDDEIEKDAQRGVVRIRVSARDHTGKSYEVEVVNPLGHAKHRMSSAELAEKFQRLCQPWIGKSRAAMALEYWENIQKARTVNDAFDALHVDAAKMERK